MEKCDVTWAPFE